MHCLISCLLMFQYSSDGAGSVRPYAGVGPEQALRCRTSAQK